MRARERFTGCFTAIVTPMREGRVDGAALDALVEAQIAGGVSGIVPVGTTGESPTLTHEEHRDVIRRVVERVGRRVRVMAGCGSNATDEALSLTRYAEEVGADATLQVVPYYNKPTQEGIYRHMEALARHAKAPIVLYNVPGRTAVSMSPATVARCFRLEPIAAIKEASGSIDQTSEILDLCEIDVLSGDDSLTLPLLAVGALGVVSVASNVVPAEVQGLCDAWRAGRTDEALSLHRRLFPLVKSLFLESNPGPVKAALALLSRCGPEVRLPLVPPEPGTIEKVRAALVRFGLPVG